jgi:EmrB/QacA subfamily drug resistance transporter
MSTGGAIERIPRRAWAVLTVVSLCSVQNPLSQSILVVAFPRLEHAFAATPAATLSWVISAYSITAAATLVIAGVMADRYGRKRILLIGGVGFGATSVACGLAPSVGFLLVMRVLQALFGALLTPAGASLVLREFPPTRRATAIAAWAAAGSVATAIGPTLGALLVDAGGWRWSFWVNAPFTLVGVVLVHRLVAEMPREDKPFPDLWSVPLIMMSVSGIILGISQSGRWGWGDRKTIGSIVVGALLGAYLVHRSSRHPRPMLDLELFRFAPFRLANIASIVFGSTFFAVFFGFPRFTQEVWGYDVREAGLLLLPIPIAGMLFNGLAGKFADTRGHRPVMMLGGLLQMLGGVVMLVGITAEPDVLLWLVALTFVGLGTSLIWPAIFGNTVLGVPPDRYGEVTSINQTAQRMATAVGAALAVSLVGEAAFDGVGPYVRIFALTAVGGVLAMVIGWFMGDREPVRAGAVVPAVG